MCGVLSISGNFGALTVARIIVDSSGYYAVELIANTPKLIPTLGWTCVLFSDFTGTPPPSQASFLGAPLPSFKGGMGGGSEKITGSPGNACVWAGLSGNLETVTNEGAFGDAFAFYAGPETIIGAQNVTSYAFCSGYSAPGWKRWQFSVAGNGIYRPMKVTSIGLNDAEDWCYMTRIEAYLLYPSYHVGPISASLILSGANYSIGATPPGGTWLGFNCLPLKQ
jgi:hypothetical protein